MSALTCAFDRCQAGGTILEGAPRVPVLDGEPRRATWFHPGCWAAELHRDRPHRHTDVRTSKEIAHA